jgi:hypothetical protein
LREISLAQTSNTSSKNHDCFGAYNGCFPYQRNLINILLAIHFMIDAADLQARLGARTLGTKSILVCVLVFWVAIDAKVNVLDTQVSRRKRCAMASITAVDWVLISLPFLPSTHFFTLEVR